MNEENINISIIIGNSETILQNETHSLETAINILKHNYKQLKEHKLKLFDIIKWKSETYEYIIFPDGVLYCKELDEIYNSVSYYTTKRLQEALNDGRIEYVGKHERVK